MAFTRRFQNNFGTATTSNPQTLFSVQLFDHETLVVFLVHTVGTEVSVVWNGQNLTRAVFKSHATANVQGSIWLLEDAAAATSNIVVTFGVLVPTRITADVWAVLPTRAPLTLDQTASAEGTPADTTASSGVTHILTHSGEFAMAMIGIASGIGSATAGNGFTSQGAQHSGGATDNVTVVDAYKLNEYGTAGLECTWGPLAVNWVAMIITLKEALPLETQISQVVEDLEYTDIGIRESKVLSLLETTDQEMHITQLVSLLEYHRGVPEAQQIDVSQIVSTFEFFPPPEIDVSQIVSMLEYHLGAPAPDESEIIVSQEVSILEYQIGQRSTCYQTPTISDAEARFARLPCN